MIIDINWEIYFWIEVCNDWLMWSKLFNIMFTECKVIISSKVFVMRISLNDDIISSSISDYRKKSIDIDKVNSLRILVKFIEYISISYHSSYIFLTFIALAWAFMNAWNHSIFCKVEIPVRKIWSSSFDNADFNGSKILTSSDWSKWEQCDDNNIKTISCWI